MVEAPLEEPFLGYYRASARMWNQLRREFLYAAEQVGFPTHVISPMHLQQERSHRRPALLNYTNGPGSVSTCVCGKCLHMLVLENGVRMHCMKYTPSREMITWGMLQAGAPDDKPTRRGNVLWRSFWGAHQRFFRHLCMAAKVPGLVRMANVRAAFAVFDMPQPSHVCY